MIARLPINVLAPLVVAIPVVLLGAWLSLMWRQVSRDAVTELAQTNIRQLHDLAEVEINEMLAIPESLAVINRQMIESGRLNTDSLANWRRTLFRQLQTFDMLSAVTWGGEDGRSAWVAKYADGTYRWDLKDDPNQPYMYEWLIDDTGEIADQPSLRYSYDLFSRPWFLEPRDLGQPVWSRPYVWAGATDNEQPTLGMSFGIPLRNADGSFRGVISTDISLQDLAYFLRTLEVGESGVSLILDGGGRLLASSRVELAAPQGTELRAAVESEDVRVAMTADLMQKDSALESMVKVGLIDGNRHYFLITPIRTGRGLNWNLATIVPESDFLATIDREFRRSTLASFAVVLLAVILGTIAARWLMRPLQRLVRRVRQISTGNLAAVTVPAQTPEYRQLGEALNDLCENLDRSQRQEMLLRRELDHRVKNVLAQIVALSRQTARRATADEPLVEELVGQVTSLSRVHELLGKKGQTGLPMHEMIEECCAPYLTDPTRVQRDGKPTFVEPKAAMALSLVCNELATNAVKYGALSTPDGVIDIRWRMEVNGSGESVLHWSWRERGGPTPPDQINEGFGINLLQAMIPFELGGQVTLQFPDTGLQYDAMIPADYFVRLDPATGTPEQEPFE